MSINSYLIEKKGHTLNKKIKNLLNLFALICKKEQKKPEGFAMRETRIAQRSIFDTYSEHDIGVQLKNLSDLLDGHPEILSVIKDDIVSTSVKPSGRNGLSVESVFRCLLLKQCFRLTYQQLAFHLSDSMSYRSFARLSSNLTPKKSCL